MKISEDKLNRTEFVKSLFKLFDNFVGQTGNGLTMVLNGKYGSGKSTVLNLVEQYNSSHSYKIVKYDAWENNLFDNPLIPILYSISKLEKPGLKIKEKANENIKNIPKTIIGSFFDRVNININPLFDNVDIFDEYDQAATFYLVGNRIPGSEHLIVELANHGHEVASHSYSHPRLTDLSGDSLHYQLTRVSELVSELSDGAIQVKTLRPPYGKSSQRIKAESPYPFILWNVDSLDWQTRNTEAILEEIRKEVSDGDVILMHELYKTSVEAVRILVPELIEQGYQLVTVEEMFTAKGIELKAGSTYLNAN